MPATMPGGLGRHVLAAVFACSLTACCCPRGARLEPAQRMPLPAELTVPLPAPVIASPDTITEVSMKNVLFHFDDDIQLRIHRLRGRMWDRSGQHVIVLDDKQKLLLAMLDAEVGFSAPNLSLLLNRYVFGSRGSPLRNILVRTEGDHIVQTGVMHKIVDIPFEMTAQLSVTPSGMIRIHTTRMRICGIDGQGLLRAVHRTLADLLDLRGAKGVSVQGNDLIMDPLKVLPAPAIAGRLTAVRVQGDEIMQTFAAVDGSTAETIEPPIVAENYIYFRGGTLRFGKLYMVATELLTIDGDPSDPFDFYLDQYHRQLTAGYSVTLRDYGLATYMPDFNDLGGAKGRLAPR